MSIGTRALALFVFFFLFSVSGISQSKVDSLEAQLAAEKVDTERVNIMNLLGWELCRGDQSKSLEYSTQALELSEKIGFEKGKAYALKNQGVIHYYRSSFEIALDLYKQAATIMDKIGDKVGAAKINNNIAAIYDIQGEYDNALNYYLEYLKTMESIGDKDGTAKANNNIGLIYFRLVDRDSAFSDKALEHFTKSLTIRTEINDKSGVATSMNNIGLVYQSMVSMSKGLDTDRDQVFLDSAMYYYQEALKIREDLGEKKNIAASLSAIANIEFKRNNLDRALDLYNQAISIQDEIGDKASIVITYYNIGFMYYNLRRWEEALKYYEKSMEVAREIDYKDMVKSNCETMSMLYDSLGNYKMALFYHKQYSDVKDELLNEQSQKIITEMKTKYDSEKKETENKMLAQKNQLNEAKLQQNQIMMIFAGIGVVLLLGFAIFILRANRQKQKANELLQSQKTEIELQRDEINIKNKHITDSIRYAQRIQQAILPPEGIIRKYCPESFTLYKPKDIVSGDFYWVDAVDNLLLFSAVDCTGHGVPGAFMSIVGSNILNQAVHENHLIKPNEILNYLSIKVQETLRKYDDENSVKDGMDLALCSLDVENMMLEFAGVHNPMYIIRGDEVLQFKPDKHPIGEPFTQEFTSYMNNEIPLEKGDIIYVFSDGFVDQFGGPSRKKFLTKRFREVLLEIKDLPMDVQRDMLDEVFENWRGDIEQYDDVCVFGIKV
ncbi:MAG: tetratricopeptide repeat protein [Bacteroidetes bacterium]|nr:tetratricopeptide repeat protein [Bacteroidota bacterium]